LKNGKEKRVGRMLCNKIIWRNCIEIGDGGDLGFVVGV